jgi:hypothetical protein
MLRGDVHGQLITMTGNSMDEPLVDIPLTEQFLFLRAVLVRPLLKVQVVEDSHGLPKVCLVAVTQFLGISPQDIPHNAAMLPVKFALIILAEQFPRFFRRRYHNSVLLYDFQKWYRSPLSIQDRQLQDVRSCVMPAHVVFHAAGRDLLHIQIRVQNSGPIPKRIRYLMSKGIDDTASAPADNLRELFNLLLTV